MVSPINRHIRALNAPENKKSLFLPYQEKWIMDPSLVKLMEKSRQIGISWATAYALVRRQSLVGCQHDSWVSSRDEIQARLFLEDCKAFADILNIAGKDLGQMLIGDGSKQTAFVLEIVKRIHSMSSNPDAQAGKRGDRTLDEFALHKDNRKLYAIAEPGLTWGGQMEIVSTHRGAHNFFNELVVEAREGGNPKNISLHRVTLEDALDQGFLYKLQTKLPDGHPVLDMVEQEYFDYIKSRAADEETFQQEYMCEPTDDSSIFIESDLYAAAEYFHNEKWEKPLHKCGDLYMGVDIGRHKDLTAIPVGEKVGNQILTRKLIILEKKKFSEQKRVIWDILALPNLRKCCMDKTGLGEQMTEEAHDDYPGKVIPVHFTMQSKSEMAYGLRSTMEDHRLKIPVDQKLKKDFRAIKKETTTSGNIVFRADSGPDGHSDRFWGYALMVKATGSQSYVPMPQRFAFGNRIGNALAARRNRRMIG